MTAISDAPTVADLPGGPYDLEFFFDPGCPFAWITSVWARRVAELRDVSIGWRFISLKFINEGKDHPESMKRAQERGLHFHRLCAGARAELGNDAAIGRTGVRESGRAFAIPTYAFAIGVYLMVALGLMRALMGHPPVAESAAYGIRAEQVGLTTLALVLLVLRANTPHDDAEWADLNQINTRCLLDFAPQ